MFRLAIVISHPIQYHAPLYSYLAKDGRFQLRVFFMSDRGARPFYEELSRTIVRYDNPILEGYDYVFLNAGEPKYWWGKKTEFVNCALGEELVKGRPQAVYFHGYDNLSFLWAILKCRRVGIKVFLRGENEDVLPRPFWRTWLRETLLKFLLPRIDAFLYIGTRNKEFFLKRHVPESKLFFVPYSVDNEYFMRGHSQGEINEIRRRVLERHRLAEGTRVFIYTHKLRASMRPVDAVRAFCDLGRSKDLHAALIMCGDGDLRHRAEELAREKGGGRIIFTGYLSQNDLREHLLAADVMINPAEEPWGCSVNEGLASGLVVISSDLVVGWPDLVIPGVNGYVYPCGNLRMLSDLIQRLCLLPSAELIRMKQESLRLSEKLSFAACADGLASAMNAVCPM